MKRCHGNAFVPVGVEFELCLCVVAVLHERHLIKKKKKKKDVGSEGQEESAKH